MKTKITIYTLPPLLLTLLSYNLSFSQNIEEMGRQRDKFMQQQQQDFKQYVEKRDKEFVAFLEKRWKELDVLTSKNRDETPKPDKIPTYLPERDAAPPSLPARIPEIITPWEKPDLVEPLPTSRVVPTDVPVKKTSLTFYGNNLDISIDNNFSIPKITKIDNKTIARFWEQMAGTNHHVLLSSLAEATKKLQLNDWGFYRLTQATLLKTCGNNTQATLATWFLLNKAGYSAKVGYDGAGGAVLLLPAKTIIYARQYVILNGEKYYYAEKQKNNNLYTYDEDYNEKGRIFDMGFAKALNFEGKTFSRSFLFSFEGKKYNIDIKCNRGVIDFYNDYPATELQVYFNTPISKQLKNSLYSQLKRNINTMTKKERAEFLLSFVQNAFKYKTDGEQFGREKSFFAEELFYYPYSDCEDRAVLFSHFAKHLITTDVVGLQYPGHAATAIEGQDFSGTYFDISGRKFYIADPTFINASIGASMPKYKNKLPHFIEVENK